FERAMLGLLMRRLGRDRRWHLRLAVTPGRARRRAGIWPRGVTIAAQGEGDLGQRMRRALAACPPGPAVLVGSDIPELAPLQMPLEPRHQLDEIAWAEAVVELVDEDPLPGVAAGAGGAREREQIGAAGDPGGGAALDCRGADLVEAEPAKQFAKPGDLLFI